MRRQCGENVVFSYVLFVGKQQHRHDTLGGKVRIYLIGFEGGIVVAMSSDFEKCRVKILIWKWEEKSGKREAFWGGRTNKENTTSSRKYAKSSSLDYFSLLYPPLRENPTGGRERKKKFWTKKDDGKKVEVYSSLIAKAFLRISRRHTPFPGKYTPTKEKKRAVRSSKREKKDTLFPPSQLPPPPPRLRKRRIHKSPKSSTSACVAWWRKRWLLEAVCFIRTTLFDHKMSLFLSLLGTPLGFCDPYRDDPHFMMPHGSLRPLFMAISTGGGTGDFSYYIRRGPLQA